MNKSERMIGSNDKLQQNPSCSVNQAHSAIYKVTQLSIKMKRWHRITNHNSLITLI